MKYLVALIALFLSVSAFAGDKKEIRPTDSLGRVDKSKNYYVEEKPGVYVERTPDGRTLYHKPRIVIKDGKMHKETWNGRKINPDSDSGK